jgi:DNA-directed RNA polymerase specialized sigma subunit
MLKHRIVIYAKDIELITGKSERSAHTLLNKIKREKGKTKEQVITITELCQYLGISEETVLQLLT